MFGYTLKYPPRGFAPPEQEKVTLGLAKESREQKALRAKIKQQLQDSGQQFRHVRNVLDNCFGDQVEEVDQLRADHTSELGSRSEVEAVLNDMVPRASPPSSQRPIFGAIPIAPHGLGIYLPQQARPAEMTPFFPMASRNEQSSRSAIPLRSRIPFGRQPTLEEVNVTWDSPSPYVDSPSSDSPLANTLGAEVVEISVTEHQPSSSRVPADDHRPFDERDYEPLLPPCPTLADGPPSPSVSRFASTSGAGFGSHVTSRSRFASTSGPTFSSRVAATPGSLSSIRVTSSSRFASTSGTASSPRVASTSRSAASSLSASSSRVASPRFPTLDELLDALPNSNASGRPSFPTNPGFNRSTSSSIPRETSISGSYFGLHPTVEEPEQTVEELRGNLHAVLLPLPLPPRPPFAAHPAFDGTPSPSVPRSPVSSRIRVADQPAVDDLETTPDALVSSGRRPSHEHQPKSSSPLVPVDYRTAYETFGNPFAPSAPVTPRPTFEDPERSSTSRSSTRRPTVILSERPLSPSSTSTYQRLLVEAATEARALNLPLPRLLLAEDLDQYAASQTRSTPHPTVQNAANSSTSRAPLTRRPIAEDENSSTSPRMPFRRRPTVNDAEQSPTPRAPLSRRPTAKNAANASATRAPLNLRPIIEDAMSPSSPRFPVGSFPRRPTIGDQIFGLFGSPPSPSPANSPPENAASDDTTRPSHANKYFKQHELPPRITEHPMLMGVISQSPPKKEPESPFFLGNAFREREMRGRSDQYEYDADHPFPHFKDAKHHETFRAYEAVRVRLIELWQEVYTARKSFEHRVTTPEPEAKPKRPSVVRKMLSKTKLNASKKDQEEEAKEPVAWREKRECVKAFHVTNVVLAQMNALCGWQAEDFVETYADSIQTAYRIARNHEIMGHAAPAHTSARKSLSLGLPPYAAEAAWAALFNEWAEKWVRAQNARDEEARRRLVLGTASTERGAGEAQLESWEADLAGLALQEARRQGRMAARDERPGRSPVAEVAGTLFPPFRLGKAGNKSPLPARRRGFFR